MDPSSFQSVPNEVIVKIRDWFLRNEKQLPSSVSSLQNVLLSISFQVLRIDPGLILDWLIQQQIVLINECGLVVYNKSHQVFTIRLPEPEMRFQIFSELVQFRVLQWLWNQRYCLPLRKESLVQGIQQFCVYRVPINIQLILQKLREMGYLTIHENKVIYFPSNSYSKINKRKQVEDENEESVVYKRQNTKECDSMCM